MNEQTVPSEDNADLENLPVLGSWNNVYLFVLVLHTLLIITFYLISRAYTI